MNGQRNDISACAVCGRRPSEPAPSPDRRPSPPSAGRRPPASSRSASSLLASSGRVAEPSAEHGVARVDVEVLPGLGVLQDDEADVGQLGLPWIPEPDGDDLVSLREQTADDDAIRAR